MNLNATLIGELIAFAVFVLFCMKFVWPPLINAIEARQKKIADGLAASDRAEKDLALAQDKAKDQLNIDKFSKNHLTAVKKHVDSLKKYIDTLDDQSLELVIMFMPIEGAYIAACNDDLISHAIKSKVAIVGPTTLIAILQIITHLWRTKKQSENISKIVKAGTDICNDIINVKIDKNNILYF